MKEDSSLPKTAGPQVPNGEIAALVDRVIELAQAQYKTGSIRELLAARSAVIERLRRTPAPVDAAEEQGSTRSGEEHLSPLREVVRFLLGEGPLDSVWFGDRHPTEKGAFWWRKHLRAAMTRKTAGAL